MERIDNANVIPNLTDYYIGDFTFIILAIRFDGGLNYGKIVIFSPRIIRFWVVTVWDHNASGLYSLGN